MYDARAFSKNVWYLLSATRGGAMRARIMGLLCERPFNPNQMAEKLGVDYKTVRHHLDVLKKNQWVTGSMDKYGELFFCAFTDEQKAVFESVLEKIGKNL